MQPTVLLTGYYHSIQIILRANCSSNKYFVNDMHFIPLINMKKTYVRNVTVNFYVSLTSDSSTVIKRDDIYIYPKSLRTYGSTLHQTQRKSNANWETFTIIMTITVFFFKSSLYFPVLSM